ncbi:hypothetical protein CAP35_11145 [Chitinophagaceae bacterium IBVUCB1]|nr:hypothetical protein CAP35_11145 [Chitinophagaceae bacterium IBVUCB1]
MKNSLIIAMIALLVNTAFANGKNNTDKVLLMNGKVLNVNVSKVTTTQVEYKFVGETVQNVEDVNNIQSITFANGRVQEFAKTADNGNIPVAHSPKVLMQNEVAVLPVTFINRESGMSSDDNAKLAQDNIIGFLNRNNAKIAPLYLQGQRLTNNSLAEAGLPIQKLDEMSIGQLHDAVGTEYIIISRVSFSTNSDFTTSSSTWGKTEQKGNKQKGQSFGFASTTENKNYYYEVKLEIYQNGKRIYQATRHPLLNMENSWQDAYEYLLKRTPIYRRK